MAVNKVVYGNDTLMDITDTTATAEDVASGKVFYGANGTRTTGSATYTETDPIYSASAAATISSSDITNWNSKVDTTDYAGSANNSGGTVVLKTAYCADTNSSGVLYCFNRTYSQYASMDNSAFISKGTLENVITGKNLATKDDIPFETLDFSWEGEEATSEEQARFKNIFSTLSTSSMNSSLYNIKFKTYDDETSEWVTNTRFGSLYSIEYNETGTSTAKFNVFPSAQQDETAIYRLTVTGKSFGDVYFLIATFEDYPYPIKTIDLMSENTSKRLSIFNTLGTHNNLIDGESYQELVNYGLYNILTPVPEYGHNYEGHFIGILVDAYYDETGESYATFNIIQGGHRDEGYAPIIGELTIKYTYNNGSYTLSVDFASPISVSIDSTSDNYTYPTSKAVYDFVTSQGGGGTGSSTDVQINGTSITSNGTANILTNTAYNSSTNKIATMSDIPSLTNYVTNTDYANENTGGVIKPMTYFSTAIGSTGTLYCEENSYSVYQSKDNRAFISKGTLENVITGKNLISTSGATMAGALVAQNNTNYTTKQVRNVVFSTSEPTSSDGANGDIWIKYS